MTIRDIEQAHERLRPLLHPIPLSSSRTFSLLSGAELYLKCENMQKTGSFKVRGAYNKVSRLAESGVTEVVAASAGNHAQGVAFAASALGLKSTIVMPAATPTAKVSATEGYGARVVLSGSCYDDAYARAMALREETGAAFVHPFDDEDVICGQATVAIEILRDMPQVDVILVPAGGGGLLAGVAQYVKQINPRVRIVGVQARGADAIARSFHAGALTSIDAAQTIADGIAVKSPGAIAFDLIRRHVDDVVTVGDDEIAEAILLLLERNKMIVEPAGAAALAAAIHRRAGIEGKRCACILSGGNIDVSFIHKIVERGLITRGRLMQFRTDMPDSPGSLTHFSTIVSSNGANIVMVQHDRLNARLGLSEAILHVACEVSSNAHGQQLVRALEGGGYRVTLESREVGT